MKLLLTLILLLTTTKLFGPNDNLFTIIKSPVLNPYEKLYHAVCMEESLCNPMAVNKREQAYGIAQIRQIRLDDYNMRTGKKYRLTDCFSPKVSKEIFMYYARKYDHNNPGIIARRWNGSGKETYRYWARVNKRLKENYSLI